MLIDCGGCAVRAVGCADCVVPAMLDVQGAAADAFGESRVREIGEAQRRALRVLAEGGLIPPLRMTLAGNRAS